MDPYDPYAAPQGLAHYENVRESGVCRSMIGRMWLDLSQGDPLVRMGRLFECFMGFAVCAVSYLVYIPWDQRSVPSAADPDVGTTPVTVSGVLLFVLTVLVVSGYLGWRGRVEWSGWVSALPFGVLMFVSCVTHRAQDANPWPVAWLFLTVVTFIGAWGVALAASHLDRRLRPA